MKASQALEPYAERLRQIHLEDEIAREQAWLADEARRRNTHKAGTRLLAIFAAFLLVLAMGAAGAEGKREYGVEHGEPYVAVSR